MPPVVYGLKGLELPGVNDRIVGRRAIYLGRRGGHGLERDDHGFTFPGKDQAPRWSGAR